MCIVNYPQPWKKHSLFKKKPTILGKMQKVSQDTTDLSYTINDPDSSSSYIAFTPTSAGATTLHF